VDLFLTFVAAFVALPMVLGPFVIKFTHWVSGNFSIKTVPAESLDHEVRVFLEKARVEFESINFEFVGYMTLADYMPNVSTCFALFIDQQSKTSAMAAVIQQKTGKTLPYYEFTSKYSNGRVINVNNSPMLGSYRNPDKSTYRYPKIKSIKNLYDIHRWVAGHDKKAMDPVGYDKDGAAEMLTEALINELKLQQQFGYYSLDRDKARFLFTWKGAFIMTEKNVFPVKIILNHLDLRSAQKAIAGMPTQPEPAAGGAGGESGKNEELGAGLKSEAHFKSGANWFFWIAALSLINSLAMKFGGSWNFIIGLGITQVIDSIAMSAKEFSPDIVFQALILTMDLGFAALFVVFGLMAQKRSLDSFEVGMVFYAIDSLMFLLVFDILGIIFHGIALFFLYRGWKGLRRLQEGEARPMPVPG
jgi:hypothetical protein